MARFAYDIAKELDNLVLGKPGPIVLDTSIISHSCLADSEDYNVDQIKEDLFILPDDDLITIGKNGENISDEDIFTLISSIKNNKKMQRVSNDSERSYYFEGISSSPSKSHYVVCWGT